MHKQLKAIRENAEFTQAHLAKLLETTPQYISGIENGRGQISHKQAVKWAELCGYNLKVSFVENPLITPNNRSS